jgi:hypothetical protein
VAGAFEFVLGREPVRRAAEVRTDGDQRIHHLLGAHDPDAVFVFPALIDLADGVIGRQAGLELLNRLKKDVREKEAQENSAHASESGGERHPGRGQDDGETAARDLALFADVSSRAPREGSLRNQLIWRDFVRHPGNEGAERGRSGAGVNIRFSATAVNEKGDRCQGAADSMNCWIKYPTSAT